MFVFIRSDTVKQPLTHNYQGPFKVQYSDQQLMIKCGNTTNIIAIDQTQTAFQKTLSSTDWDC